MLIRLLVVLFVLTSSFLKAQSYTSYFTGSNEDVQTITNGGLVLMGGATEDDEAMMWFLEKANGGDVLVIRASGSDGYNDYLYTELGIPVNSVETIVMHSAEAGNNAYVVEQIMNAEALWIAGGNQWTYVSEWRGQGVGDAINFLLTQKKAVVGGTSAGMAVLGGSYFTAENGTVDSETALNNPYHEKVTLGHGDFLQAPFLSNVVTDQHYDDPDRRGRHITFMARMEADLGQPAFGIACDEYTAVCIEPDGTAKSFGDYPDYDEHVYFLQSNCLFGPPEVVESGVPLEWNQQNQAVKVYKMEAAYNGQNTFNLNDWATGTGGQWQDWWVSNGELNVLDNAETPECITGMVSNPDDVVLVFPTAITNRLTVRATKAHWTWALYQANGAFVASGRGESVEQEIQFPSLSKGVYLLCVEVDGVLIRNKVIVQ